MMRLLKGEGWVELLFALIAISVFGVWLVTVTASRLNSLSLWEVWRSQLKPAATEQVAPTVETATAVNTRPALAAK